MTHVSWVDPGSCNEVPWTPWTSYPWLYSGYDGVHGTHYFRSHTESLEYRRRSGVLWHCSIEQSNFRPVWSLKSIRIYCTISSTDEVFFIRLFIFLSLSGAEGQVSLTSFIFTVPLGFHSSLLIRKGRRESYPTDLSCPPYLYVRDYFHGLHDSLDLLFVFGLQP